MKRIIPLLLVLWSSLLFGSVGYGEFITENLMMVSVLAILFTISIVLFVVSFIQLKKVKKLHKDIVSMEENQAGIFKNMSENISKITKDAIDSRNDILKNSENKPLEYILSEVIQTENALLDKTNDLIGFLKLKSKKIQIHNEFFNLNNVLNEVSGSISSIFKGSNVELIFDIDNDIPRFLIGDSLHFGQILHNILEYAMLHTYEGEVKLEVSIFHTFDDRTELQFLITDTGVGMESDKVDTLFDPYYDKVKEEYVGLGNFVANELVHLMGGELIVESVLNKGSSYNIVLPLQVSDPANRRKYRLPEKILTTKKVFIVDSSYNSALAIKKMFAYFKHDVRVLSKWQFLKETPNMREYDIIALDEDLFTPDIVEYLSELKDNKELKIIALGSLLRPIDNKYVDAISDRKLKKPLNQERIFELIIELYKLDVKDKLPTDSEDIVRSESIITHREPIVETKNVTREMFSDFKGSKILIVEDNLINQKVLTTILSQSGIDITLACNGEEAVIKVTTGKKSFDLVLMDINMPIMDGYTATEQIRATGAFDNLPIVAFTALVLDSEVNKMFNAGINAFLDKPLNIGKLYKIFQMYLGFKATDDQSQPSIGSEDISKIDGINIEEGIKHTNGNEALYMELLNEFYVTYNDSSESFEKLLKEHRYEQIKMLCLDMKGLAGMIGAEDMYQKVDEIHKLFIYNNQSLLASYTEEYQKEMDKLNKSIKNYLDSNQYS